MAKKKKTGPSRGATRMREQGYSLCAVWLNENERRLIDAAAAQAGKKLATWIREQAFAAAALSLNPKEQ